MKKLMALAMAGASMCACGQASAAWVADISASGYGWTGSQPLIVNFNGSFDVGSAISSAVSVSRGGLNGFNFTFNFASQVDFTVPQVVAIQSGGGSFVSNPYAYTASFNSGSVTFRWVDVAPGSYPSSGQVSYRPNTGPGTGPVPEPASWALMIAGFGLVGGAMRRPGYKQSVSVIAAV